MRCSRPGARKRVLPQAQARAKRCACLWFACSILPVACCFVLALPACSQDAGTLDNEFHGNGAEITVTVHDRSGEPISAVAIVKLFRDGSIPSGQAETTRGRAVLVVNKLGEFTVNVAAAGFETVQKDVSVRVAGRAQLDVYLRPSGAAGTAAGTPGKPVLAPKAKEALDKGLQALSTDRIEEAEKYVSQAVRLAPAHPDVLYVQGVLCLKKRDWAQAQNALEKATQIDPAHARAFSALGMALFDQGKYEAAIAPLVKSLQLEAAGAWETRWVLAKTYYQHEQYDEALKASQEALGESHGKAPEIALLVAQALTAVGRYEDAARSLREFLRDHGDRREALTARRWLEGLRANGKIQAN